ncbi:adenine phosphoribosyltransferase [Eurytemora carolleeae]|uniref:adenine phosphoribosyltransferase n=1 Tax=Eurytemora carolleeae TaxID=1294199 RepID=UPI000C78F6B6|nr:adenine phosphoribosyltransferase [Eurytemora carolleeae]|eukprot:XP_023321825.1 adenine phosphoribosyltransferase-like [Eurytemora affinis]
MSGNVVDVEVKEEDKRIQLVRSSFSSYPDFPKPGILFHDIFAVFSNPIALEALFSLAKDYAESLKDDVDVIVGLDSRGFLLGPIMANHIQKPFVPARKKGKLPGKCVSVSYSLEYGDDQLQMQESSMKRADRVLIVDDLLATGGTMKAAVDLVKKCGGEVVSTWVVVELADLKGRPKIQAKVESLLQM